MWLAGGQTASNMMICGEDLGNVPPEVGSSARSHRCCFRAKSVMPGPDMLCAAVRWDLCCWSWVSWGSRSSGDANMCLRARLER